MNSSKVDYFWHYILSWYSCYGRQYPWRTTNNPYFILVAEFLLQKTNVKKVEDIYVELISSYPTVHDLAKADVAIVEKIIKKLGLHYRATRLINCARMIVNEFRGQVPDTEEKLLMLPGVGQYISNAVLSYAFDKPSVPVDTNVIRLFTRFFGLRSQSSRPYTDSQILASIRMFFEKFGSTRVPNLAVLDFASIICTAKNPRCKECLIHDNCSYISQS